MARALLDPAIDEHLLLDWAIVEVGHALDPGSNAMIALGFQRGVPTGPMRPARPFTPSDVVSGLARIDVVVPDAVTVQQALVMSVDTARYWQEPDGTDLLAALPSVAAALRPFADAIVASAAGRWWTDPIALRSQVVVALDGRGVKPSADLDTDPTATVGGTWWSVPPHPLVCTAQRRGGEPVGLRLVEDAWGAETARVFPVEAPRDGDAAGADDAARADDAVGADVSVRVDVLEIDGPEAWADLCRRFPLDVTATRSADWRLATGRVGRWVIPDWAAVAEHHGGVHVSVAGYLRAAGRAIQVDEDTASVMAGWDPDSTVWFVPVDVDIAHAEHWRLDDEREHWHRELREREEPGRGHGDDLTAH